MVYINNYKFMPLSKSEFKQTDKNEQNSTTSAKQSDKQCLPPPYEAQIKVQPALGLDIFSAYNRHSIVTNGEQNSSFVKTDSDDAKQFYEAAKKIIKDLIPGIPDKVVDIILECLVSFEEKLSLEDLPSIIEQILKEVPSDSKSGKAKGINIGVKREEDFRCVINNIIENYITTKEPSEPAQIPVTDIYDEICEHKGELQQFTKEIINSYSEALNVNYDIYYSKETDTFIDAVITSVVQEEIANGGNLDINYLLDKIKSRISQELDTDPLAPENFKKWIMMTDDYLLSDEEKAVKNDLIKIGFDTDPVALDDSDDFDYSVMNNADTVISTMVNSDGKFLWDYTDIDTIVNKGVKPAKEIFDNLNQMKPQLKEYIKQQLEAQGLEYNEAAVDKYLNYFMSEVLRECVEAHYHNAHPDWYPNVILSPDATMKDLAQLLVTKVKNELAKGPDAFSTDFESGIDFLLLYTSDYLLTDNTAKKGKRQAKTQWNNFLRN